ncbi:Ig-like domain-containing protein [Lysinibacillus boronitolerans]|uniref:SbsA Ig-like domain-containing protein n=1 Tax=Lysinibacillus boronitolerans JCM 21713 = 10a = NBRC 103108 TaxID=1294264 RepID=A0ABR4Y2W8_9BACI|nr:Ig-like domain-containing protein [Lysinibacillus boronitolerans]KGR88043.1 hypothetical protein CD31_05120 [Lysinibacillus boronitolerans JCM 21713 = 10a = NBRC 103108]
MKKTIQLMGCLLFLFCFTKTVYASDTEWIAKTNINVEKEWTVTFNEPIDVSTVSNDTFYIIDTNGNRYESLVVALDEYRVLVTPINQGYNPNTTYSLIVNNVKNFKGKSLEGKVKMNFTTESFFTNELSNAEYLLLAKEVQLKIDKIKIYYPIGRLSDYEFKRSYDKMLKKMKLLKESIALYELDNSYEGKLNLKNAKEQLGKVKSELDDFLIARRAQLQLRSLENILIEYTAKYDNDNNHAIIDKKITEIQRQFPVGNYSDYEYEKVIKEKSAEISTTNYNITILALDTSAQADKKRKELQAQLAELELDLDEIRTKRSSQLRIRSLESLRD